MKVTEGKPTDFIPDKDNANQGTQRGQKMIQESLQEDGAGRGIVVDKNDNVVAGNKTLESAVDIGIDKAIIVETTGNELVITKRLDWDLYEDESPRRYAYRDNRSSEVSLQWDPEQLLIDKEAGVDFSGLFYDNEFDEITAGLKQDPPPDPDPQISKADELQKKWGVKLGDVWQLGRHKIACIDSLDEEAVRVLIGGDTVGMVWADPPYGINIVAANGFVGGGEAYDIPFGGRNTPKGLGSSNGSKPFGSKKVRGSVGTANLVNVGKYYPVEGDDTTETACRSALLSLKLFPEAIHFWWGGNYYTNVLPPSSCWVIWDKDNTGNFADCEMAWTNQSTAARIFEHRWNGMLKASEQGQRRVHPTQKPIALASWCFGKYGKKNDVIFDPFLGSGISAIAAEKMDDGRRVIGCEIVPEYIAVCLERAKDAGITSIEKIS